jgi:hypothetical protein
MLIGLNRPPSSKVPKVQKRKTHNNNATFQKKRLTSPPIPCCEH